MDLYVKESTNGKGLFTTKGIKKGEEIFKFTGKQINYQQAWVKGEKAFDVVQIDKNKYLDPDEPYLFINHSCHPNAGLKDALTIIALREIKRDEELTFDYSTCMDEPGDWVMRCNCEAKICRNTIENFKQLPKRIQNKYLKKGVVPQWILEES